MIKGRGVLGNWGANFAADPIVTYYDDTVGNFKILLILRENDLKWAFPGGMVDPEDSNVSMTAQRELKEETELSLKELKEKEKVKEREIYKGYVDDPRNTDNAWMETSAIHYHLDLTDEQKKNIQNKVRGGDDALHALWFDLILNESGNVTGIKNRLKRESKDELLTKNLE
jgi:ADP-ribose pyrophosphatase